MSFSYTSRPGSSNIDKVRFLVDDKDEKTHLIENEEISYLLSVYGTTESGIYGACAIILETMAVRDAKRQEHITSNSTTNVDNVAKKLEKRAAYFRANSVTPSHFKAPSISDARKQAVAEDSDVVNPFFRRNMFKNPSSISAPDRSEDDEQLIR